MKSEQKWGKIFLQTGTVSILTLVAALSVQNSFGDDSTETLADTKSSTSLSEPGFLGLSRSKMRMQVWLEYMSPFFQNIPNATPDSDNLRQYPPSYGIMWMDYDIGKDYKILYWQRSFIFPNNANGFQGIKLDPRNPRFALRKVNVLKIPNLSSTYDLYVQLGLGSEADRGGRHFEFGLRTNHSYSLPNSRWSFGLLTEVTRAFSGFSDDRGADLYGWLMPWVNFQISKVLSTQHYFVYNFQHVRGKPFGLYLDDPRPYIQNGVGVNLTDNLSTTFLINNNTLEPITLKTTWFSVWLNWALL